MLGIVFLSGLVSGGSGEAQRGSSANKYQSESGDSLKDSANTQIMR
jgi:hypothetical protein